MENSSCDVMWCDEMKWKRVYSGKCMEEKDSERMSVQKPISNIHETSMENHWIWDNGIARLTDVVVAVAIVIVLHG